MIIIKNLNTCRELWEKFDIGRLSFGVTGSFEFRKFYSSLFNMDPYFICDDIVNPSYILPLCNRGDTLDWFGTKELEDIPFYCGSGASYKFLSTLKKLNMSVKMPNINELQLAEMQEKLLVKSSEESGVKVVVKTDSRLTGKIHWSDRNINRAIRALEAMNPKWTFDRNPTRDKIKLVFDDSIEMFSARNIISKLGNIERQQKYLDIFTSQITGIQTFLGTCFLDGKYAISALILVYKDIATIPTITINIEHSESKVISQYGFRYAIVTLSSELKKMYGCKLVDYQGGNYSWKKEVDVDFQLKQFKIELNYETI